MNGGEGYYSGKGHVRIPYLGNVKLAVHFDNILLNTDRQLLQGTVVTEYDPTINNILDTGDVVETIGEVGEALGDIWDEIFKEKEKLLDELAEAENLQEQQAVIVKINTFESITVEQQINQIKGKENLPQELQQELDTLKMGGNLVTTEMLSQKEIADIETADARRRDRIREIAEVAEDGYFLEEAQKILNDSEKSVPFWETIERLEKIYEFLEQCNNEDWASYQEKGIVPYCLWRDVEVSNENLYSGSDVPYLSGLVDGVYIEVDGVLKLPELLKDFGNGMQQLIYSFTVAYIECNPMALKVNRERLNNLLETIEVPDERKGLLDWMKEELNKFTVDEEEKREQLQQYLDKCQEFENTRNAVDDFFEFITDWKKIQELCDEVSERLKEISGKYGYYSFVNEERYERALLDVQILSIATGVGALTKIKKVKDIFQALRNFTQKQWDDLGKRFGDDVGNVVGKFTTKQIDDYVLFATKQSDQSKVMLGLYDNGGTSSYITKAGNNHTYFDMGTAKWAEAENIVAGNLDEMWKINKKFIDDQKALGKEFWFSHDPFSPIEGQFYAREINYLIDEGVTDFVKIGDSWKAVW